MEIIEKLAPVGSPCRPGIPLLGFVGVTVHNTSNHSNGANAIAHGNYLRGSGKNKQVSWHYVIDKDRAVRCIPENETAWCSGDGNGNGNRKTINIEICDNTIEPEIAMFSIRGNTVMSAHGHKDSPSNVVQNFTLMFGIKPNIVLLGHRHLNGLTTVYDTKVIESGCVSGEDQYATSIRKSNRPEQTVSVIGENGLICLYDIQLD